MAYPNGVSARSMGIEWNSVIVQWKETRKDRSSAPPNARGPSQGTHC